MFPVGNLKSLKWTRLEQHSFISTTTTKTGSNEENTTFHCRVHPKAAVTRYEDREKYYPSCLTALRKPIDLTAEEIVVTTLLGGNRQPMGLES